MAQNGEAVPQTLAEGQSGGGRRAGDVSLPNHRLVLFDRFLICFRVQRGGLGSQGLLQAAAKTRWPGRRRRRREPDFPPDLRRTPDSPSPSKERYAARGGGLGSQGLLQAAVNVSMLSRHLGGGISCLSGPDSPSPSKERYAARGRHSFTRWNSYFLWLTIWKFMRVPGCWRLTAGSPALFCASASRASVFSPDRE